MAKDRNPELDMMLLKEQIHFNIFRELIGEFARALVQNDPQHAALLRTELHERLDNLLDQITGNVTKLIQDGK